MSAALYLFLQQLAVTTGIVLTVLSIMRRREIMAFLGSHYSKARRIQLLEDENAYLRNSLSASTLANEGFEGRISQLSGETRQLRESMDSLNSNLGTLSAKFVAGIAYIASKMDHGDTSMLPELIRADVDLEVRRQRRAVPPQ